MNSAGGQAGDIRPPMAMLAELTHRCPLACPYCSNPLDLKAASGELDTAQWIDVFDQAAQLGVLHLHLSGGEPASRRDLEELVAAAAKAGLYSNLITSGLGLTQKRMEALAAAGLDHVQLSIQGTSESQADHVAGYKGGHMRKLAVAQWVSRQDLPLTVNAVMHRSNIDEVEQTFELALELGAHRLEVATVQFHGWAAINRNALMPTRNQVERTTEAVAAARERLKGRLVIDYVPADYYAKFPKPCMGGWGRIGLNVDPTGQVLPCHAAETIPQMQFDNVRDKPLSDIWYGGEAFNRFRGTDWMQEPCASCEHKLRDFGGCRCQALAIAGDANATDPACSLSPLKGKMVGMAETAAHGDAPAEFRYRGRQLAST